LLTIYIVNFNIVSIEKGGSRFIRLLAKSKGGNNGKTIFLEALKL